MTVQLDNNTFDEHLNGFLSIYDKSFHNNNGGMGSSDMFSLYYALKTIKPTVVIESGIFEGLSTKLIRKTVGNDCKIICIDPNDKISKFKDTNKNTTYYVGKNFVDFKNLDLSQYSNETIFAFFDDHQNAFLRLSQSYNKNIKYLFFNDNYPKNCGSHYSLEHVRNNDTRHCKNTKDNLEDMNKIVQEYYIFPNIFQSLIRTMEGDFLCSYIFKKYENPNHIIFYLDRDKYRWNTFVKLG